MTKGSLNSENKSIVYSKAGRKKETSIIDGFQQSSDTQTQFAKSNKISRTTLQYWIYRKKSLALQIDPEVVNFFESPSGLAFLHQLSTALIYSFEKESVVGHHTIRRFLQLSQLNNFIACSIGTLKKRSNEMDNHIITYGNSELERLSSKIKSMNIPAVLDETFFRDKMILVMMEPCSNFILTEEFSEKRDASSWENATSSIIKKLNIKVLQANGDAGTGLTSFVLNTLGAHKSPDLFHVLQDLTKAISGQLARSIKSAERALKESKEKKDKCETKLNELQTLGKGGVDPSKQFQKKFKSYHRHEQDIEFNQNRLEQLREDQEIVCEQRKIIGDACHPFNIRTGEIQTPKGVKNSLTKAYEKVENVMKKNDCSDKRKELFEKSRSMVPELVSNLVFFWRVIMGMIREMNLEPSMKFFFIRVLVARAYLKIRIGKCRNAKEKKEVESAVNTLEVKMNARDGPWATLSEADRKNLLIAAQECAEIFQRSSSCVEGRNGVLSHVNHGKRRLSAKDLKVRNIIHNFAIERKDGTTCAERLFKEKPRNLFKYLLEKMDFPIRPRRKNWESFHYEDLNREAA